MNNNSWTLRILLIVAPPIIGAVLWWVPRAQIGQATPFVDKPTSAESTTDKQSSFELQRLENENRRTLAQILFGLGVFLSLYVAYRRALATEEGQITERFAKAIDHIGDAEISKILGGIHALGRIARDSEKDRWIVIEILSAYVRDKYPLNLSSPDAGNGKEPLPPMIAQTILSLIGRSHNPKDERKDRRLNLQSVDVSGANLDGAYLKDSNFRGSRLKGCDLSNTNLENADFEGADLSDAVFVGAYLKNANFEKSDLRGAIFLDAKSIMQIQLETALIDDTTRLPDELDYSYLLDTTTD